MSLQIEQLEQLYDTWEHKMRLPKRVPKIDILGSLFLVAATRKPGETDRRLLRRAINNVCLMNRNRTVELPRDYDNLVEKGRKLQRRMQNEKVAEAVAKSTLPMDKIATRCSKLGMLDRLKLHTVLKEAFGHGLEITKAYRYLNAQLASLGV